MGYATHEVRMTRSDGRRRELVFAWRGGAADASEALERAEAAREAAWAATVYGRSGERLPMPGDLAHDDLTPTCVGHQRSETVSWTVGDAMRDAVKAASPEWDVTEQPEGAIPETRRLNDLAKALLLTSPAISRNLSRGAKMILHVNESGTQRDQLTCDGYLAFDGTVRSVPDSHLAAHVTALSGVCAIAAWLKARGIVFQIGGRGPLQLLEALPESATICAVERAAMIERGKADLGDAVALLRRIGSGALADGILRGANP